MTAKNYYCQICQIRIESWFLQRPSFECPCCGQLYRSNYRQAFTNSLLLGIAAWLSVALLGYILTDSWEKMLALSIELGLIIGLVCAFLAHRVLFRVERVSVSGPGE